MITLIKGFNYDNSYDIVKTFKTVSEQNSYFNNLKGVIINNTNYVKEHESFNVRINYDELIEHGVNYLIFDNGQRNVYAFITRKIYLNDKVTKLEIEIDVIQTYMFEFNIGKSFIERKNCSINEITDYDEGIEIGEHIVISDTKVIDKTSKMFAMFTGFRENYINEVDGKIQNITEIPLTNTSKPITNIDGIDYPLSFMPIDDSFQNEIFQKWLLDNPSLVGIVRMPSCSYTGIQTTIPLLKKVAKKLITSDLGVTFANSITSKPTIGGSVAVDKGDITDFFPYTYYVLTDGETEPLIMQPQYCGSTISVNGKYALSHAPIERFFPTYYKGSTNGDIYNITNGSTMMLPCGTNGGIEQLTSNMSSIEQQKKGMSTNLIMGIVGGAMMASNPISAMAGIGAVSSAISGISSIKQNMARNKDLEMTPSSIQSYGSPSTRNAFGLSKVRIVKYSIEQKYKDRLKNYIARYGNKYNNYSTVDVRSYRGFIKYINPNIDGKIDNVFSNKLIEIFERGVLIE